MADDGWDLRLEVTKNNSVGDGTTPDVGKATLAQNGYLQGEKWIKFKITSGKAWFTDTDPSSYITYPGGQEIDAKTDVLGVANVHFVDKGGDSGILTAVYKDDPTVAAQPQPFGFDNPPKSWVLVLNRTSQASGQAVITYGDEPAPSGTRVRFDLTLGSVSSSNPLDQSGRNDDGEIQWIIVFATMSGGQCTANATCSYDNEMYIPVYATLKASLPDHPEAEPHGIQVRYESGEDTGGVHGGHGGHGGGRGG